jgi:hypothetical protein
MNKNAAAVASASGDADAFTSRLVTAAGGVGEPTRQALSDVTRRCAPETIDALEILLLRLRTVAPDRIASCPVVAFTRCGIGEGVPLLRGAAITADGAGCYHVHSVFWHDRTARWDGTNGRYGVSWDVARDTMNERADAETPP